jgi:hypothetical protein
MAPDIFLPLAIPSSRLAFSTRSFAFGKGAYGLDDDAGLFHGPQYAKNFKTGHYQNQITPLGVKTGQYRFQLPLSPMRVFAR